MLRFLTGCTAISYSCIDVETKANFVYTHFDVVLDNTMRCIFLVRDPRDAFLSHCYYHCKRQCIDLTSQEIREYLPKGIEEWTRLLTEAIFYKALIIQYETLCLFPEQVLLQIIKYWSLTMSQTVQDTVEQFDSKVYKGIERYQKYCLKWQRDSLFTEEHNEKCWSALKSFMNQLGYTKDGHLDQHFFGGSK